MLNVVILAAGQGTRMQSALPKPLHCIGGKPMLEHVLDAVTPLNPSKLIVVYGHEGQKLLDAYPNYAHITFVEQKTFRGTGDAMAYALPELDHNAKVLLLYADTPLVKTEDLRQMVAMCDDSHLAWLTVDLEDPAGYGRIIRENGQMIAIIEDKDASIDQQDIKEINSGIFVAPAKFLNENLAKLKPNNVQNELYLTDIVGLAVSSGLKVISLKGDPHSIRGVNDRVQLAQLERLYQAAAAHQLMLSGVSLIDPARIDIRGELHCGLDCLIDVNVIFEGKVILGDRVHIGAGCIIKDAIIADDTKLLPYSLIDSSKIGKSAHIGPFSRIRPNSVIGDHAKIGNFVETKNVTLGVGAKANHLSYIGDATIGDNVNLGAGTITCNYDGINKFKTVIKANAFIGSNSALIAPITIGENATVGAGSVVTEDVPNQALVFTRAPIRKINDWERPKKIKK